MNLQYLFEIQAGLDRHIEDEHPRKEGEDRLSDKILALQVELGELANEWRGFKFWKVNQQPVTSKEVFCTECGGTGTPFGIPEETGIDCYKCEGAGSYYSNPLLEEYVDCLHFILSIGLELDQDIRKCVVEPFIYDEESITNQFIEINYQSHLVISAHEYKKSDAADSWFTLLDLFAGQGKMLGFTWEQIEQAYLEKNKVNHERQVNGY